MRGRVGIVAISALLAVGSAALAAAERPARVTDGNVEGLFNAGVAPKTLPKVRPAPVSLILSGRFRTLDGSHLPATREYRFDLDRHLRINPDKLPTCERDRLSGTDSKGAEVACRSALVGSGFITSEVEVASQRPFDLPPRILVFNGGSHDGVTTLFVHAYIDEPVSATLLAAMKIKRAAKSRYGLRAVMKVPMIAAGRWSITGFDLRLSKAVYATCPDSRLWTRSATTFADGSRLAGTLVQTCLMQ